LRLFPEQSKAADARRILDLLQKEMASARQADGDADVAEQKTSSVEVETRPKSSSDSVPVAHVSWPPAAETTGEVPSFWRKNWSWIAAGIAVATGLVLGIVLTTREDSPPLWGRIP